jgi:hypothetical protein
VNSLKYSIKAKVEGHQMLKAIGIFFFVIGCLGVYWVGKRNFERTNAMGVQEFKSYGGVVGIRIFEGLIKIAGLISIIFGFLGFCIGWGMDR